MSKPDTSPTLIDCRFREGGGGGDESFIFLKLCRKWRILHRNLTSCGGGSLATTRGKTSSLSGCYIYWELWEENLREVVGVRKPATHGLEDCKCQSYGGGTWPAAVVASWLPCSLRRCSKSSWLAGCFCATSACDILRDRMSFSISGVTSHRNLRGDGVSRSHSLRRVEHVRKSLRPHRLG